MMTFALCVLAAAAVWIAYELHQTNKQTGWTPEAEATLQRIEVKAKALADIMKGHNANT